MFIDNVVLITKTFSSARIFAIATGSYKTDIFLQFIFFRVIRGFNKVWWRDRAIIIITKTFFIFSLLEDVKATYQNVKCSNLTEN